MEKFKLFGGEIIDDLSKYIGNYLNEFEDVEIYIGTDSSQKRNYTNYVTCISFLKPRKGVHVIYSKNSVKKIRDNYTRLWRETEYSEEVATTVKQILIDLGYRKNITVHLDYNKNPKYKSFIVHDAAMGYITSLGFLAESKNNSWCASVAADMLCQTPRKRKIKKFVENKNGGQ